MDKEPITINCFNKLKEELVFLKEKKDQKLLLQFQKQDLMEILKKMRSIMPLRKNNHIMKEELQR